MHPSSEVEREYLVRLRGTPSAAGARAAAARRDSWTTDPRSFDRIEAESVDGSHSWFRVCLHEGRNREVRRLFEHEGFEVSRLSRIRYGNVILPADLRAGAQKMLDAAAIGELSRLAGSPAAATSLTALIGSGR